MRSRAKSIRSKTREDFMKKTQLAENEKKMYLAKRRMSKDIRDLEQFKIDFDTELNSLRTGYTLENIHPPLEEQQRVEENILYNLIKEMNNKLSKEKTQPCDQSFESQNLTDQSTQNNEEEIEYPKELDYSGLNIKLQSNPFTNGNIQDDVIIDKDFIRQNIIAYNTLLKIIVLGDKKSGKTMLINNITQAKAKTDTYEPTVSLDILKRLVYFKNRRIQLEFFDTNEQIFNSTIINIYYKFSDGVIYIINPMNLIKEDKEQYISKLYSKIKEIKYITKSTIDISIVVNETDFINSITEEEKESYLNTLSSMKEELKNQHEISLYNFDISSFNINSSFLKEFLIKLLENKELRHSL